MNAKLVALVLSMAFVVSVAACAQCGSCSVTSNNFPLSAQISSGGDDYVYLTESTTCTVVNGECVITGTITFEPGGFNCCTGGAVDWRATPTQGNGTMSTNSSYGVFADVAGPFNMDDSSSCSPNGSGEVIFTPTSLTMSPCPTTGVFAARIHNCGSQNPLVLSVGGVALDAAKAYYCY